MHDHSDAYSPETCQISLRIALSQRGSFLHADAELIADAGHFAVGDVDVENFFALHLTASFIGQRRHDLLRVDVDDFTGGGIGETSIEAHADPADAVAHFEAGGLLRRHHGVVENVDRAVVAVGEPEFFFVVRERDAVGGAAVALHGAFLITLYFHVIELLAGFDVADFETEQIIRIDVDQRIRAVHREWTDDVHERADGAGYRIRLRIGDRENGRMESGEIDFAAVRRIDRVV